MQLIIPGAYLLGLPDVLILRTSLQKIKIHSNTSC